MKVLVTGGSGFLGKNLIQHFIQKGWEVINFDIIPCAGINTICGNLENLNDLLTATNEIDYVCHFAGVGDVYLAEEKPYIAASANVVGTANVLEACYRNHIKKLVYASTWEVYGIPKYTPIDEEHPCNPTHPYNITKFAGEMMVQTYRQHRNLNTVILRMGTAYGIGMRANSVFSIFINKAIEKKPIIIKGDGKQFRQFIHAKDIAEAFEKVIMSDTNETVFNITGKEKVSIKELADIVVKKIPTEVIYEEARKNDITPSEISSKKAEKILNWIQKVKFSDGLKELINYTIKK